MISVKCRQCNKAILKELRRVNENLKLRNNFYCSRRCQYEYQTLKKEITCENIECGKLFLRRPKAYSTHNYCSRSCAIHVNNSKFPKRESIFKICANKYYFKKFNSKVKYCSMECLRLSKWHTPSKILEVIKEAYDKTGRTPSRREFEKISKPLIRFFGSWNNALIAAGLTPNRSHSQRMYRRVNTTAQDGHR